MKKYYINYEVNCLDNYESTDTTRNTDCWFDAGLFLFLGNPKLKNYFLSETPGLAEIFETNQYNTYTDEFRLDVLNLFEWDKSILNESNDIFIFAEKFNLEIFFFDLPEEIPTNNKPFIYMRYNTHFPLYDKITIGDTLYSLESFSLLSEGALIESVRDEHWITVFKCSFNWYVADNQVPDLVEYENIYHQKEGRYEDFTKGWNQSICPSYAIYFPII